MDGDGQKKMSFLLAQACPQYFGATGGWLPIVIPNASHTAFVLSFYATEILTKYHNPSPCTTLRKMSKWNQPIHIMTRFSCFLVKKLLPTPLYVVATFAKHAYVVLFILSTSSSSKEKTASGSERKHVWMNARKAIMPAVMTGLNLCVSCTIDRPTDRHF